MSMLSLVVSDVVLINIWMHDIGRYKGAGYQLLTTIFEANLKIFGDASKKTVCFVIRDYDPNTSMKITEAVLKLRHLVLLATDSCRVYRRLSQNDTHKSSYLQCLGSHPRCHAI